VSITKGLYILAAAQADVLWMTSHAFIASHYTRKENKLSEINKEVFI